jgi:hypothetical protein
MAETFLKLDVIFASCREFNFASPCRAFHGPVLPTRTRIRQLKNIIENFQQKIYSIMLRDPGVAAFRPGS